MMKFTEQEKVTILKAMDTLIKADNDINAKEVQYLEAIVEEFDWDNGFLDKLDSFKKSDALEAVKNISSEKLLYFKTILHDLAESDSEINAFEKDFLDQVDQFILENA
ncbi:MAG: hypothetical protein ACR2MS_12195 [Weeksellaceae bacterium]